MKIQWRRWLWLLIAVSAFTVVTSPSFAEETKDSKGIVAVVNGDEITRADFDREMAIVQRQLLRMRKPQSALNLSEIKKEVLESLINKQLLYQESRKKDIRISEAELNKQMQKVKERFPDEKTFKELLQKEGLSLNDLKSQIKRDLVLQRFIDTQFVKNITVSDQEMKAYYEGNLNMFKKSEQVQASHILIKVDPEAKEADKAKARATLEKIQKKLKTGGDFAALAGESSECPSKAKGGDLGYFGRGQMVKPFEDVAFSLKKGEVSDIVETGFGYHLIKVTDKKPETIIAYTDVKEKLTQYLKQQKLRSKIGQYIDKLKETAKITRYSKENTD
jgi:peptidyl-prolyl cis-trans isomerase C